MKFNLFLKKQMQVILFLVMSGILIISGCNEQSVVPDDSKPEDAPRNYSECHVVEYNCVDDPVMKSSDEQCDYAYYYFCFQGEWKFQMTSKFDTISSTCYVAEDEVGASRINFVGATEQISCTAGEDLFSLTDFSGFITLNNMNYTIVNGVGIRYDKDNQLELKLRTVWENDSVTVFIGAKKTDL